MTCKLATLLALFSTLLCTSAFTDSTPPPYTVIEDKAKLPILSPAFSARKVMKLKLSNGLEAFLISDPKTDKSGAVLSVQVGSFEDPDAYPGIAHFLEHMLFLGTQKYPEEAEYDRYISEHGGSMNAFTTHAQTSYIFSINNGDFAPALDRFSSFFKEPLFNPSGVSRELQAIDQEYAKNLENDDFRLSYIDKALANPKSPFHRFHIGNSETLSEVSQDTLKSWYRDHYSANLMHLVVYSALPIEQLKELVIEDFKEIPSNNHQSYFSAEPLHSNSNAAHFVYIEPVQNKRSLTVIWELPAQFASMLDRQPVQLACYVLGHEGEESLLAELKRKHLAEGLECSSNKVDKSHVEFYLEIKLTNEGVTQVNQVIELLFQAIANFKQKGLPRYLFDELQHMQTLNYQYQSRVDAFEYMTQQASWIVNEDLSTYPEQTLIVQKYDPNAVKALLDALTPQNAHFYITAPAKLTGVATDAKEPWLGGEYAVKPIDAKQLEKWSQAAPNPAIALPAPNPFIPKKLTLVAAKESKSQNTSRIVPLPETILNDDTGLVYYANDTRYLIPQVSLYFEVKTPQIVMSNATKIVLADLYVKSLTEALSRFTYTASLAGLEYKIKRVDFGIGISIDGYSENANLLFEKIIAHLKTVKPTEEQFNIYKDAFSREYQDFAKKLPVEQAFELLRSGLHKNYTTEKLKALCIGKISFEQFQEYAAKLFEQVYIKAVLFGDLTKSNAKEMIKQLTKTLQASPYPKDKQKFDEIIILPEDQGPFVLHGKTKAQGNATVLAIQYPEFTFKSRAMQQILMTAIKEAFFSTLRTKQQTGYLVYSDALDVRKHMFNIFAVQSNTHQPLDLLNRFELFIEGYLQEITTELSEERFNLIRESLLDILKQPPKSIEDAGALLQKLAYDYDGDFNWMEERIEGMQSLEYSEFLEMSRNFLDRQNKRRVAVLFSGVLPKDKDFRYLPLNSVNRLRKLSSFSR